MTVDECEIEIIYSESEWEYFEEQEFGKPSILSHALGKCSQDESPSSAREYDEELESLLVILNDPELVKLINEFEVSEDELLSVLDDSVVVESRKRPIEDVDTSSSFRK